LKYTLKKPIKLGEGEPITHFVFREEVVAGDMRGIPMRDPMHFEDILKLAGRLCAQPDAVINKMSFADLTEVNQLVAGFIGAGLETGSTASQS
jgi:hypothetical protein